MTTITMNFASLRRSKLVVSFGDERHEILAPTRDWFAKFYPGHDGSTDGPNVVISDDFLARLERGIARQTSIANDAATQRLLAALLSLKPVFVELEWEA